MIAITIGIIAEFNPLHRGHQRLITAAKSRDDSCVVVLSSNFTQRGSPSLTDKFTRTRTALDAGADLVLELPVLYSCSAAQDFARGAVNLLARTHFAGSLAFGMESPEWDLAGLVRAEESGSFREALRVELGRGASYPKAYGLALESVVRGAGEFVSHPNNMLALSYAREVLRNNYALKVFPVKREGVFSSRVIREDVARNVDMLPEFSRRILEEAEESGRVSDESRLWPVLQGALIRSNAEDLRRIHGIDEGIEGLLLKNSRINRTCSIFLGACVCARYTRAHIRRRLIYILLGLDRWEVRGALRGGVPYARVLGFTRRGREILRKCGKDSEVKIITRLPEAEGRVGKYFAEVEYRASRLYELTVKNPNINNESQRPVIYNSENHL